MLNNDQILDIIQPKLEEKGYQLIDLRVNNGNAIMVEIDSKQGVTITDCVEFSRLIEGSLDREIEDFELQVASPGLSEPFKVVWQYKKNIGRDVDVVQADGKKLTGNLIEVNDNNFKIKEIRRERVEGKKKKQDVEYIHDYKYEEIKTVKVKISFK